MAGNSARHLFSNGLDARVTIFDDGRIKVWSVKHLWEIDSDGRHTALGQYVRLRPGAVVDAPGGTESATTFRTDPALGLQIAGTVGMSNGSFVYFEHSGGVVVGNDTRDIAETFNGARQSTGGSVMVTFLGTMRPRKQRDFDHFVNVPEKSQRTANRLYPGEVEILDGKIKNY